MSKSLSCPSCGAPLDINNRFVKVVTCDFCGQVMALKDTGLDPTGQVAKLTEIPSLLYVGAIGRLEGKDFEVMGRLRYQYTAGLWDEWFLIFGKDRPGWLVEDEGEYILYHKETLTSPVPAYEDITVGQVIRVAGRDLFVTEKGQAKIAGSEGQLAFTILPNQIVRYVDGNSGNEQISLEYTTNEIELSVGRAIAHQDLIVEEEDFY